MQSIFVSSIQEGYADVREAARRAVESLGMRPLMAELAGASPSSPQRALLDLVAEADVLLLILGSRYSKPTEDEFDEARRRAKEILVLRQSGDADPEQEEFVRRVAGGWEGGRLWGSFADASDVGFAVVRALTNLTSQARAADLRPQAEARARELAAGQESRGYFGGSGSVARVAHAPLLAGVLLDAVRLDEVGLGDRIASLARAHNLVAQSVGIEARVTRAGVALAHTGGYSTRSPVIEVCVDGAVVCDLDVAGDDNFGGMRVDPTKLERGIAGGGEFASAVWAALDEREEVQHVAVAVAIPDAQHKVFGSSTGRNSISMGGFDRLTTVLVPEPPAVVRRAEVGSDDLTRRLISEVRRVFVDAGAIER